MTYIKGFLILFLIVLSASNSFGFVAAEWGSGGSGSGSGDISGSGTSGEVAVFSGSKTITSDSGLSYSEGSLTVSNALNGDTLSLTNGITTGSSGSGALRIGDQGITMYDDDDGGIIFLGNGTTGTNEDFKMKLSTVGNVIEFSSSTDATDLDFSEFIIGAGYAKNTLNAPYTIGTDNPLELYGGVLAFTNAVAATVPAAASPYYRSFTIDVEGAHAVSAAIDAGDYITLGGTTLAMGNGIITDGTTGSMMVFEERSDGWKVTSDTAVEN